VNKISIPLLFGGGFFCGMIWQYGKRDRDHMKTKPRRGDMIIEKWGEVSSFCGKTKPRRGDMIIGK
jgi:hypothetical protein